MSPAGQLLLREVSHRNLTAALQAQVNDPERGFVTDLCWSGMDGCAGDARLYDWKGLVQPVLFTARNGATISGRVWATRPGPGIVITNGSVQADEQMYWYAAQALARAGYVVLTWDPQGQGQSDTFGEGSDRNEGFPAQTDGRPFFDGTTDALNFFLSTPAAPYVPVKSCTTGTSHAAKQARRAAAGLNAPYNPFHASPRPVTDRTRRALLRRRGRLLRRPGRPPRGRDRRLGRARPALAGQQRRLVPPGAADCPGRPPATYTKPALNISADYFLPPTPNTSEPDPNAKSAESLEYSKHGVDTGSLVIRGGTHYDFSFISEPGVRRDPPRHGLHQLVHDGLVRLLRQGRPGRRRAVAHRSLAHRHQVAAVEPDRDGNLFSFYYRSRLDIDGFTCEDLRTGCPAQGPGRPARERTDQLVKRPPGRGRAAPQPTSSWPRACDRIVARVNSRVVGRSDGRRGPVRGLPARDLHGAAPRRPSVRKHVTVDAPLPAAVLGARGSARRAPPRCGRCPRPTHATGTPGGIWAIDSSASSPPATEVDDVSGTPITGRSVCAAHHARERGGEAGARDDHPQPAHPRVLGVLGDQLRVAVGGHHPHLVAGCRAR